MDREQLDQLESRVRDLLASGGQDAAATLVCKVLGPHLHRYLGAVLRDPDDADDALSIVLERIWRGLSSLRSGASLRPWCYRIAYNAALNLRDEAWRRRARRLATGEASKLADTIRRSSTNRRERQADALAALRRELTPEDQSLLSLRLDQGLSWNEIAEVLGGEGDPVTPNAATKRYERLRERLEALARKRGLL